MGRALLGRPGPQADAGGGAGGRDRAAGERGRRGPGPEQHGDGGLLGPARRNGGGPRGDGSTPATAASSTTRGIVSILDRKKDVIITGGENVSSIEVEDAIFSLDGVAEVAVIGVPHDTWGEMVIALVVPADGHGLTEEDVTATAGDRWPATSARNGSSSATSCPARPPASCRSSGCGPPTGKEGTVRSTDRAAGRPSGPSRRPGHARPDRRPAPLRRHPVVDARRRPVRRLQHGHVPDVGGDLEAPLGVGRAIRRAAADRGTRRSRAPWSSRVGWLIRRSFRRCPRDRPSSATGSGRSGDRRHRRGPGPTGGELHVRRHHVGRHPGGVDAADAEHPVHGLLGGGPPPPLGQIALAQPGNRAQERSWRSPGGWTRPGRAVGSAGSIRTSPATESGFAGRLQRRHQATHRVAHQDGRRAPPMRRKSLSRRRWPSMSGVRAASGVSPWPTRSSASTLESPGEERGRRPTS